ncbi:MAG: helix-turn-helix transcriptional regulator [Bacteroidota bacterium]
MMQIRIKEMIKEKGIKFPYAAMVKAGISRGVALKYMKNKKQYVLLKDVEILCLLFRCVPNDLYVWVPNDALQDDPTQPLQAIKPKVQFDPFEAMKKMTPEEIRKRLE